MRGARPRFGAIIAAATAALALAGAAPAAAPSNDNFSSASVLLPSSGSRNGTNVDATKEAGEPDHTGNAGGSSVWYRWVAPYTGIANFDTYGSGLDTLLAVYTGPTVGALTQVAQNDDALGYKWTSALGFAATAGTTYYIAVDGFNDGTNGPAHGTFAVNWDLTATPAVVQPNDNFASAVGIDGPGGSTQGSNFGATKEMGEPNHAANAGGKSVWFRWTAPYDGVFTFSTDSSNFNTLLAVYLGIDVGNLVQVTANDDIAWNNFRSSVTFTASAGSTYSIALDGKKFSYSGAASGNYVLAWMSQSASPTGPANDFFGNPQQLAGASGAVSGSTVGATKETGEPAHAENTGGASAWYTWTAPSSGNATISTAGSSFDTLLGVYTGSSVSALAQVTANDDVGQTKGVSEVTFAATAGATYRVAVDGYLPPGGTWAARGDVVLSWSIEASAAPANDDFDAALTLTGIGGIFQRSTLGATKQPGEPDHAGNPGGASVWIRWTAPGDGQWRFYTSGSTFNTVLGVYTGDSVDALTLIGSNDDVSGTDRSSSVTIIARNQTTYWMAVDGYRGASGPAASGDYTFQWELLGPDPALASNDDFAAAWQTSGQSGSLTASSVLSTKQAGEPNHAGNAGGASVWVKWTAPVTAYVSWDTPGSSFDTLLAAYTGTDVANLRQVAADDDIAYNTWWPDGHYRESFLSFIAQQGVTYYIAVDGKSAAGGAPARGSIFMEWWQNLPAADATLLAAGDVHASCTGTSDDETAQILASYPTAAVASIGDNAGDSSTAAEFANCYTPSWGQYKARTRPAVGNHEYDFSPNAAPYFAYFGSSAGAPNQGWYSYELGGWHVVVLNSDCAEISGCGVGSAQYQWLQQDLAANVNGCTLAYWHHALYASSTLKSAEVRPFWDLLYQYGADLVVNAHARHYERFTPMAPDGTVDNAHGIREFVVGTGGGDLLPLDASAANSELAINTVIGVLKLTLKAAGYDWQFMPIAGSSLIDTGHGSCAGGSAADPRSAASTSAPTASTPLSWTGQYTVSWTASPDIPTGASYTLQQRSTASTTWSQVATGITATSYVFNAGNARAEGTWVYRVQATGAGKTSDYSAASAPVVVDKSGPLPPLVKPDRPAEYLAGGWWRDQVVVSFLDNGDAVLADGTPGSGVDKATLKAPVAYKSNGTFTASGQVADMAGWTSLSGSLTVKVDVTPPTITLKCPRDVKRGNKAYATFQSKDDQSGLATPPSGSVLLDSSTKGRSYTISVDARDNVGHVKAVSCDYNVK